MFHLMCWAGIHNWKVCCIHLGCHSLGLTFLEPNLKKLKRVAYTIRLKILTKDIFILV
jgi:hypothetical protein